MVGSAWVFSITKTKNENRLSFVIDVIHRSTMSLIVLHPCRSSSFIMIVHRRSLTSLTAFHRDRSSSSSMCFIVFHGYRPSSFIHVVHRRSLIYPPSLCQIRCCRGVPSTPLVGPDTLLPWFSNGGRRCALLPSLRDGHMNSLRGDHLVAHLRRHRLYRLQS